MEYTVLYGNIWYLHGYLYDVQLKKATVVVVIVETIEFTNV